MHWPDNSFEDLEDLFAALHTFGALGHCFVKGSKIESLEKETEPPQEPGGKSRSQTIEYCLIPGKEPEKLRIPSTRLNLFKFSCKDVKSRDMTVEGPFNDWGEDINQSWDMTKGQDGLFSLYFDLACYGGDFSYRYYSGGRYFIDQRCRTISIHPEAGICTSPDLEDFNVYGFNLSLDLSFFEKQDQGVSFKIISFPVWMDIQVEFIEFNSSPLTCLPVKIFPGQELSAGEKELLVFENLNDDGLRFEIPVELYLQEEPIQPYLRKKEIFYKEPVGAGDLVEILIPLYTKGKGKLNIYFFGTGVQGRHVIESLQPEESCQKIACRIDTTNLSYNQARNLTVRIVSDTAVANARFLELKVHLELLYLHSFPVSSLNWQDLPLGKPHHQKVEFLRSDSLALVKRLDVTIPPEIRDLVKLGKRDENGSQLKFIFLSPAKDLETRIDHHILIKSRSDDGKCLLCRLPIKLSTVSVKGEINFFLNRRSHDASCGDVSMIIRNLDEGAGKIEMSRVQWQKGVFKRFRKLKEEGASKWPFIPAGEEQVFPFSLNRKRSWLFPKYFSDTLELTSNIRGAINIQYKIRIILLPWILSLWSRYFMGRTRLGEGNSNGQRFIALL